MTVFYTRTFPYTHGHVCRPNQTGDYEMVCPRVGVLQPFVPFLARQMQSGVCQGCGKDVTLTGDLAR